MNDRFLLCTYPQYILPAYLEFEKISQQLLYEGGYFDYSYTVIV